MRRGLQCAWWTSSRQVWLVAGGLRLAEEAVLSACPRKDLERKAGEGSRREAEEARGGGCVQTGRSRPGELPDAGSRGPEPAKPAKPTRPPLLPALPHPSRASAPARLVAVLSPAGGPTVRAALPARSRSARQRPGVRHVAAAAQRRERR